MVSSNLTSKTHTINRTLDISKHMNYNETVHAEADYSEEITSRIR